MGMNALPPLATADLDHVLAHTEGLWDELRDKRLFVTGGTGFLGRWLLETLVRANERMDLDASAVVLSRNPGAFQTSMPHVVAHRSLRLVAGDMCWCEMKDEEFDYVIHAASEPLLPVPSADPLALFEKNVAGTRNSLELARCSRARRFLFISSGAVYGPQPAEISRIPEDFTGAPDPLDPLTTYGQAKRTAEFLCTAFGRRHGIETVVARGFAFVGPHLPLNAGFAVGNFISHALHGGPILVDGDGTSRRSYLYAADLAVWLWTILVKGQPGRAYNVGSDADLSVRELADEIRKVVVPLTEVRVAKQPEPGSHAERYVPDITRARTELGLDVSISLPEAIRRTADWYASLPSSVASRP
jgi:nucleoside-diphosphate-sugar epimerase